MTDETQERDDPAAEAEARSGEPAAAGRGRRVWVYRSLLVLAPLLLLELTLQALDLEAIAFVQQAKTVARHSAELRVDYYPSRSARLALTRSDGTFIFNFLVTTHRLGFRCDDRRVADVVLEAGFIAEHGIRQVHCAGDSFTMGWGESWSGSYPAQLERLCPPRWRVVNLGKDGFGMIASLAKSRRIAAALGAPRAAVYLFTSNDFQDDRLLLASRERGALYHWARGALNHSQRSLCIPNIPFAVKWYRYFDFARGPVRGELAAQLGADQPHAPSAQVTPVTPEPASVEALRSYAAWCREQDVTFLVATVEPDSREWQALAAVCQDLGVATLTLRPLKRHRIPHDGHLNAAGGAWFADSVRRELAKRQPELRARAGS